jgi:arylsulfatase A-like enzyme
VDQKEEDRVMSSDKNPKNPETSADPTNAGLKRRDLLLSGSSLVAASALSSIGLTSPAHAQQQPAGPAPAGQRPNIVFIMGDDIGWFNIGAYHQGIMASRTPNLDKLAAEGMRFTDYYAEASCTAGRANFITGELPIRTGLTTVGQAGSSIGMPAQAPTIATALKSMGYATGQFGKNHLGDLNEFLPTVHGFDEFYGYLYHLDAMEDPAHRNYPQALLATVGPRNMVHSWATDRDDPTVQPRWGKIGKQRIEDAGTLYPKRMETVDDEILQNTSPSSTRPSETTNRFSSGSTQRACMSSLTSPRNTRTCATPKTVGRFPRAGSPSLTISSAPS